MRVVASLDKRCYLPFTKPYTTYLAIGGIIAVLIYNLANQAALRRLIKLPLSLNRSPKFYHVADGNVISKPLP